MTFVQYYCDITIIKELILRALFLCNVDFFLENRQNLWKKEFWMREVMSLVRLELKPPRSSTLEWIFYRKKLRKGQIYRPDLMLFIHLQTDLSSPSSQFLD